jgi:hypothetical protein
VSNDTYYLNLIYYAKINKKGVSMYIANIHFGKYRIGDQVPMDLPNNDERLSRGLIREVKVINPEELKAIKDVARKPKIKSKQD